MVLMSLFSHAGLPTPQWVRLIPPLVGQALCAGKRREHRFCENGQTRIIKIERAVVWRGRTQ